MLILADFVRPTRRNICLRDRAFIEQAGGLSYCVAPQAFTCQEDCLLVAYYQEEFFEERSYTTALRLPAQDGSYTLRSGLTDITYILSFLADQPEWLDRLRRSDGRADDETIVRSFGIDPEASCRPSVKGWSAGNFLAPDSGGYAYFLVEPFGEIAVISRSTQLLPVAFHFAADREADAVYLAARLGKTSPAPDDGLSLPT